MTARTMHLSSAEVHIRALDAKNRPVIMPIWVPLSCTPQVIVPAVQHATLSIPIQSFGVAVESLSSDNPQKFESCFTAHFRIFIIQEDAFSLL